MLNRRGRNSTLYNYEINKPKETQRGHKGDTVSTVTFKRLKAVEKTRVKTREKILDTINEGVNCSSTACRAVF